MRIHVHDSQPQGVVVLVGYGTGKLLQLIPCLSIPPPLHCRLGRRHGTLEGSFANRSQNSF